MDKIKIKITRCRPAADSMPLPEYATSGSAGMDLRAATDENIEIHPGERAVIPTGLIIQLPDGYEGQVRPRSGLAAKFKIGQLNAPGTIDSDYRGEIKVILMNFSNEPFIIRNGDRIAQLIVAPYSKVEWEEVRKVTETERGDGGFGHTGRR